MRYIPSVAELRKSFQLRSREYLRENTLHGFNYFVDPSLPLYERIFWFLCTVASLCGAVTSIAIILQKFSTNPMLTVVHIPTANLNATFPRVLLCMSSEYLNLSKYTEDEASTLRQVYDWNWNSVTIAETFKRTPFLLDVFNQSLPACGDIFANCEHHNKPVDCSQMFQRELTAAGYCCTVPEREITVEDTNPRINFSLLSQKTLNVYLLPDREVSRGTPITYRLNRNVVLRISLQITTTQPAASIIHHTIRGCIITPDEGSPHRECRRHCEYQVIWEKFHCLTWWKPDSKTHNCRLSQYNMINSDKDKLEDCWKRCYLECTTTWYNIDKVKMDNFTIIVVKNWPAVRYHRKVIFGILELVVSFGGIMGLFLGYSVLTTIELIYYFTLRTYWGAIITEDNPNITHLKVSPRGPQKRRPLKSHEYRDFYIH